MSLLVVLVRVEREERESEGECVLVEDDKEDDESGSGSLVVRMASIFLMITILERMMSLHHCCIFMVII